VFGQQLCGEGDPLKRRTTKSSCTASSMSEGISKDQKMGPPSPDTEFTNALTLGFLASGNLKNSFLLFKMHLWCFVTVPKLTEIPSMSCVSCVSHGPGPPWGSICATSQQCSPLTIFFYWQADWAGRRRNQEHLLYPLGFLGCDKGQPHRNREDRPLFWGQSQGDTWGCDPKSKQLNPPSCFLYSSIKAW
jgi:hypothetical protein